MYIYFYYISISIYIYIILRTNALPFTYTIAVIPTIAESIVTPVLKIPSVLNKLIPTHENRMILSPVDNV